MQNTLLIIKLGDTMPALAARKGDFEDWIVARLGGTALETKVVDPRNGEELPDPAAVDGIVISGSHEYVTDQKAWSCRTSHWIASAVAAETPLLGICYGHQLLADAMGGLVAHNPKGMEYGTVDVHLNAAAANDVLFADFPQCISVHASHTQSVISLPDDAVLLASNPNEAHHAFSIGSAAWGVQFHPEFDADIMATYIKTFADVLKSEGNDIQKMLEKTRDTNVGPKLMARFTAIVLERVERSGRM